MLEIREAALGRAHPEVAACLNNLAVLLKGAGRHAEALAMYERCIAIKQQAMGPTHPQARPPAALSSVRLILVPKPYLRCWFSSYWGLGFSSLGVAQ